MNLFYMKKYSTVWLLLLCIQVRPDVLIFDMDGVLLGHKEGAGVLFASCGALDVVRSCFSVAGLFVKCKVSHPRMGFRQLLVKDYFDELAQTLDPNTGMPYQSKTHYQIYSDDGVTPMPPLLKDLMLGAITYEQARDIWYADINAHPFFYHNVFEINFNPDRFISMLYTLPTVDLLQYCAQQVNGDGTKKHCCMVLSNMGVEAAERIKQKFAQEITPYVNCWVYSGNVHCAKPDRSIYDICLHYIATLPEHMREKVFFIDDQQVNRDAACACIPGIICMHPDDAREILTNSQILA